MSKIIALHAFRGGTGKTTLAANMGAVLSTQGLRVGLIDLDLTAPGLHPFFGLGRSDIEKTVNGFLRHAYPLSEAAYEVPGVGQEGALFLLPAAVDPKAIIRAGRDRFDHIYFSDGCADLIADLGLDLLLIDTHPGLDEAMLLSLAAADGVGLLLRPDEQDYDGTRLLLDAAGRLEIKPVHPILNKVPAGLDADYVRAAVEKEFDTQLAQLLPHSAELMGFASGSLFALNYPWHELTGLFKELGNILLTSEGVL